MAPRQTGRTELTKAQDAIVATLCACETLLTFTMTDNADAAREKVFVHHLPSAVDRNKDHYTDREWDQIFPCVIVQAPPGGQAFSVQHDATGEDWEHIPTQVVYQLRFERPMPDEDRMDEQDAWRDFEDSVLEVMEEFIARSSWPGMFACSSMRIVEGPGICREFERLGTTQVYIFEVANTVEVQ